MYAVVVSINFIIGTHTYHLCVLSKVLCVWRRVFMKGHVIDLGF